MSTPVVSLTDFATYMHNDSLDETRAAFILDKAQILCESVVKPLPAGAEVVVLDVAQRAYAVPPEGVGPFGPIAPAAFGSGGLFLTRANKATLRRLNGSGTAFSIDMLPAAGLPALPPWDAGDDLSLLELP